MPGKTQKMGGLSGHQPSNYESEGGIDLGE